MIDFLHTLVAHLIRPMPLLHALPSWSARLARRERPCR